LGAAVLFTVALTAFFAGRHVEKVTVSARAHLTSRDSAFPVPVELGPPSYQRLAVAEILGLPFADFYEALLSAPADGRKKWAAELTAMPDGPRRTAAVSGFYKLLVQFDPVAAVKEIRGIQDVTMQKLALGSAVNAAPGFAMPLMADLSLSLQDRLTDNRDYLSDVVLEWALIDVAAVARFMDDHAKAFRDLSRPGRYLTTDQVISEWAAVDPKAAKEWIVARGDWDPGEVCDSFIEGWYENDRTAAAAYVLAHVDDPAMRVASGVIVRNLYHDSREEAAKFVESLPEEARPLALRDAFHNVILGDEKETGDTALTPQAVGSWIIQFPPSYWHEALGRLFRVSWGNAEEMLSWIQQQPPSIPEPLAAEYEAPFWKSSSDKIMPILQVADPILRDQLLAAIVVNGSLELEEARTAIATAPLSVEQKRHFLEIVAAAKSRRDHEEAARMERARAEADQGSEK
jgi:hypothetical protein